MDLPKYAAEGDRHFFAISSSLESTGEGSSRSDIFQMMKKRKIGLATILFGLSLPLSGHELSTGTFVCFAKIFGFFSLVTAIFSNVKTRRRQSVDATSEWQRYAQRPAARGRAIMLLMVKQVCFIAGARIAGLLGMDLAPASLRKHAGRKFSNGLLKLGPLYIKLGQIVSCRPGLLGEEWVDALSDLQDKVPARMGQKAVDLVYSALDGGKEEFDRVFQDFDSTPLAAASLGQVHKAKLRGSGKDVALKVQRPHLRQIYDQDFALLTTIAKWMDKLSKAGRNVGGVESSWTRIFSDAESILYREIDYRDEAENAVRFATDFGLDIGGVPNTTNTALARNNQSLPDAAEWLRTPYVYMNLSNERLLVQEYVPSFKVTDKAKLDAANIPQEDRVKLADDLARAYLRQFCSNLFFSTDPHPGKANHCHFLTL
jgi:predicted unusual protein kinase regulating ubiquinone biosynthesis (AarF/ABC1/UbiB family)